MYVTFLKQCCPLYIRWNASALPRVHRYKKSLFLFEDNPKSCALGSSLDLILESSLCFLGILSTNYGCGDQQSVYIISVKQSSLDAIHCLRKRQWSVVPYPITEPLFPPKKKRNVRERMRTIQPTAQWEPLLLYIGWCILYLFMSCLHLLGAIFFLPGQLFWCFLNIVCHFLCTISTPCSQMRLLVTLEPLATKNLDPMQRCLMCFYIETIELRTYTEPPMFLFFPQPVFISTVNKSHTPTLLLFCLALYCCPGLFINTSTHLYTACSSALLCCLFNILYIWGLYMNPELRKRANVGFIP